jgi:methyltransferase (TIGR00027 family)
VKEEKGSWTAEGVTFYRALESARPAGERACYDPLAADFLSGWFRFLYRNRLRARIARLVIERGSFSLGFRYVTARTGYIDDCLAARLADGFEQLVILGAGFDTRAYRFSQLKGRVRVFEVDHPATQAVKRDRVEKMLGSLPGHVTFVPVDFERETLAPRLSESGYDSGAKTHFIWEGVTTYLTDEAVDETLAFVAGNSPEGSTIVFTYPYRSSRDGAVFDGTRRWQLKYLDWKGEPPIFGIERGTVGEFLADRGFALREDLSGAALAARYVPAAAGDGSAHSYNAIAWAAVDPRARA